MLSHPDFSTPLGVRDRAMLEALYSTGVRRNELLSLQLDDVHLLKKGIVLVSQGKGSKDRVVPIGLRASVWLEKHIDDVLPTLLDDDAPFVFWSSRGGRLGNNTVPYIAKSTWTKRG